MSVVEGAVVDEVSPEQEQARLATLHALEILDSPPDARFDRIIRLASRLFEAPMVAVNLIDEDRQWHKANVGLGDFCEGPRSEAFCDRTIRDDAPFVIPDTTEDPAFRQHPMVLGDPHVRFYAGQPLRVAGHRIGALCLLDTEPRHISEAELSLLRDLADIVERELGLHQQLVRGRQVQEQLAPLTSLSIPGYDIAGGSFPAGDVSGDFFDFYPVDDGLHIVLADVMGKGVPAALLGAGVRATLRGGARFNGAVEAVNRSAGALEDDLMATGTFVTLFAARLDPERHTLTYVDAGHGLGIHLHEGGRSQLTSNGLPLGVLPAQEWEGYTLDLAVGDTVIAVSDGLLDLYTDPGAAAEAASEQAGAVPTAVAVVDAVGDLLQGHEVLDDVTVIVIRRTS